MTAGVAEALESAPEVPRARVTNAAAPAAARLLNGMLDNRGMILITAAYGLLWQVGLLQPVWDWAANGWYGPDLVRDTIEQIAVGGQVPWGEVGDPPRQHRRPVGAGARCLHDLVRDASLRVQTLRASVRTCARSTDC